MPKPHQLNQAQLPLYGGSIKTYGFISLGANL